MSHKQITPFGVIISQNLGDQACTHKLRMWYHTCLMPHTCMSAECSCACIKHLGTSISDANISLQNMIMLMPGSQDTKVPPFSRETSCLLTPTHRLQYVYTLPYRIPKWVHEPTIISFSKVWCQLEFVQFIPLLLFLSWIRSLSS
jgi:hypothetical protein